MDRWAEMFEQGMRVSPRARRSWAWQGEVTRSTCAIRIRSIYHICQLLIGWMLSHRCKQLLHLTLVDVAAAVLVILVEGFFEVIKLRIRDQIYGTLALTLPPSFRITICAFLF
jgi:hypothetical protein